MTTSKGKVIVWPYPLRYGVENEISADVLVLGGGIAGCWAAISASRKGLKVVVVDKGDVVVSGAGGAGCDHWLNCVNPGSKLSAEEILEWEDLSNGGYYNGLSRYIAARESYDTLLEYERLGVKIRDSEDEFRGAAFRDEETKLLYAYDYENRFTLRVWGAGTGKYLGFKRALYQECNRLGITLCERVQATCLLSEGGVQGARIVGATGVNIRTGEFLIFRAKATVMALSRPQRIWRFVSELSGFPTTRPHTCIGNGHAMAWRSGAEFCLMERSSVFNSWTDAQGYPNMHCQSGDSSSHGATYIDNEGRALPWMDGFGRTLKTLAERYRPGEGQRYLGERATDPRYRLPGVTQNLPQRVRNGEFKLPFWVDWPSMPEEERRVVWEVMIPQEGKMKWNTADTYKRAGFDPSRHQPLNYDLLTREPVEWWREQYRRFGELGDSGGLVTDWNLQTNVEGLYCAGDQLFASNYHSHAAATGRYAGRKAADFALRVQEADYTRSQVDTEKERVYAPVRRDDGIEWKEMNAGSAMVMERFCGAYKSEALMRVGLWALEKMEKEDALEAFASDPHKLGRTLDVLDLLTVCRMIIQASLARRASSSFLNFYRVDFLQEDPPGWHKFITLKQEEGEIKVAERPLNFWGPPKENYDAHNRDYVGFVKE
jgi:succinate dehydrogenase/fumarate reductase flavoprotein subunit